MDVIRQDAEMLGLNAPFGARCFLTNCRWILEARTFGVLMPLLALGAF